MIRHIDQLRYVLLAVLLGVVFVSVDAAELEDRRWIEASSSNFRLRSLLNEKDTLELLRYMEMFRVAVGVLTNVRSTEANVPTRIIAFRSASDFQKFGVDRDVAGFFTPSMRDNLIVLRDTSGMSETSIILHEYVHFLMRNHGGFSYPKWYDEGFAEYLSSTKVRRGKFAIGLFPESRRGSLQYSGWIPLRKLLSADDDYSDWSRERKAMFYAQSWALVHFLHNRKDRTQTVSQDMARYIGLVEDGQDDVAAFEEAFGLTSKQAGIQLKRYLGAGRFGYFNLEIDQLLPDWNPQVAIVSRSAIALELGNLALRRGKLELAENWFTIAMEDDETRARGASGLGDVYKFRDLFAEAEPYFLKSVEWGPDDPLNQLDVAEFWHDWSKLEDVDADMRVVYLTKAREHYVKSWKLDDSIPETYARYGETFTMGVPNYETAIDMLEEAAYLLPSNLNIRARLALIYAAADRVDDAIATATSVVAWSHNESWAFDVAKKILNEFSENPQ